MGPKLGGERCLQALQVARVFWGYESRPDRAEGNLYVHGSRPSRAEDALYVQPTCLDVQGILCTVKAFEKFNLLIYWFQKIDITYPTLQMIKTWPNWRLSDDKTSLSRWGSASRFLAAAPTGGVQFPAARKQAWPCIGYSVRPLQIRKMSGRTKSPLHVQAVWKLVLLIYWFQKSGITYPTLEMIKMCPKRCLFNNKNDVFWMGFGFKIWRCDISSLEPVPHKQIGSTNTPITCSRIAWTCKESFASQNLDKCNVLIYWFQ